MPPVPPYTVWISASVRFLFDQAAAATQHQRTINKSSLFFSRLLFFFSQMPHMKFWGVFYLVSHVLNFKQSEQVWGHKNVQNVIKSGWGHLKGYLLHGNTQKETDNKEKIYALFYSEGFVRFKGYLSKVEEKQNWREIEVEFFFLEHF